MQPETITAVSDWQNMILLDDDPLEITFHGGEPLLPGIDFYKKALPLLSSKFDSRDIRFSLQSNLWLLTDELCDIFSKYRVGLGTSLDGPEQINDAQRGSGYFQRTMSGIKHAQEHGLGVGCICTFTNQSAQYLDEVFSFFVDQQLDFSIHAALPALGISIEDWALNSDTYGQLLIDLLDHYLPAADHIRIGTLDSITRSISTGRSSVCTFGDCLGHYLAVDPQGFIYPCQRFAGMPRYQLANVHDLPTLEDLAATPFWQLLQHRQDRIEEECGDCAYLNICRGGCPYNVLAENNGNFNQSLRDPHCLAYKRIFSSITDRALNEVFSEENLDALMEKKNAHYGLLHKGRLIHIMRGDIYPKELARHAREIVSAAALGKNGSPAQAMSMLDQIGAITQHDRALASLTSLQQRLKSQSRQGLINAYLHVTYRCNLRCNHCYAQSSPHEFAAMPVDQVVNLVRQAAQVGFRKAVITGGEPLMHPQRDQLLDALKELRQDIKPLKTVLRTNLVCVLTSDLIKKLADSTYQIVVSVDGDRVSHDARRGIGNYVRTVENIKTLLATKPKSLVTITSALTAEQALGKEGESVHALTTELGIPVRIKSILPIGRGAELNLNPDYYTSLDVDNDTFIVGTKPVSTCGLGMNLYIAPAGDCYPCYTLIDDHHHLGNVLNENLAVILARNDTYRQVTVDSNMQCHTCDLRYLCGGFCRAWSNDGEPDAPPTNCIALYNRAYQQLVAALEILEIPKEKWGAAGFPLPVPLLN